MRFFGEVGYGVSAEDPPGSGVWKDVITKFNYQGDVVKNIRNMDSGGDQVNVDISVNNAISIVADDYANANFLNIRYVAWAGKRWTVTSVEVRAPRLILNIGSVYNGPTA